MLNKLFHILGTHKEVPTRESPILDNERELIFEDHHYGLAEAQLIAKSLETNDTLTALNLRKNQICASGAAAILLALNNNSTLTELNLEDNQIDSAKIGESLAQVTCLKSLDLTENFLGSQGFCEILKALENNQTLTSLTLNNNRIGFDAPINDLATLMGNYLAQNRSLKTLNLKNNSTAYDVTMAIGTALATNTTLEALDLTSNAILPQFTPNLLKGLETNESLTYLNLSDNILGSMGGSHLATILSLPQCRIKHLNLDHTRIGLACMWQLSTALCTNNVLEELILSRDNLVSPAGAAIAAFLKENNSIKVLDLQRNQLTAIDIKEIAAGLMQNSTLKELNLMENNVNPDGAIELARGLEVNQSLTYLNLSLCNISTGAEAIAHCLTVNQTLTSLLMNANLISEDATTVILDALAANTSLETLSLNNNRGIQLSALTTLLSNTTLTNLQLDCHLFSENIYNVDLTAFKLALEQNYSITSLSLPYDAQFNNWKDIIARNVLLAEDRKTQTKSASKMSYFCAMFDYEAQTEEELSFTENKIIYGYEELESGWWYGECEGNKGYFAIAFVFPLYIVDKVIDYLNKHPIDSVGFVIFRFSTAEIVQKAYRSEELEEQFRDALSRVIDSTFAIYSFGTFGVFIDWKNSPINLGKAIMENSKPANILSSCTAETLEDINLDELFMRVVESNPHLQPTTKSARKYLVI